MSAFTKTLCVGAGAGLSLPLFVLLLAPRLGAGDAVALHGVSWTVIYLACLARGVRERVAVAAAAASLGGLSWALAGSLGGLVVMLGVVTAAVRSAWLYRRQPVRALVVEAIVLALACATAGWLYGSGLVGTAIAVWAWFVVQSFYFLLGGLARRGAKPRGDAFEEAARRLESLLEATG